MLARLVVRDVGRVLNMPLAEVDRVARLIPRELGTTIHSALKGVPELLDLYKKDDRIECYIWIASREQGGFMNNHHDVARNR